MEGEGETEEDNVVEVKMTEEQLDEVLQDPALVAQIEGVETGEADAEECELPLDTRVTLLEAGWQSILRTGGQPRTFISLDGDGGIAVQSRDLTLTETEPIFNNILDKTEDFRKLCVERAMREKQNENMKGYA